MGWRHVLKRWCLLCSPGLLVVLAAVGPVGWLWLAVGAAAVWAALCLTLATRDVVRPWAAAAMGAVLLVGYAGLVVVSVALGWLVLALGLLSTPPVTRVLRRELERRHGHGEPGPRTMTDTELCQAWRRTYAELDGARDPERRAGLVGLRQAYLDELGRRHPGAIERWLSSGASADGTPDLSRP